MSVRVRLVAICDSDGCNAEADTTGELPGFAPHGVVSLVNVKTPPGWERLPFGSNIYRCPEHKRKRAAG